MANLFVGSDWHLFHENIIAYGKRPFQDAKEMNEALLDYHNEIVKPSDHFWNLGDVTMLRKKREAPDLIKFVRKFNGHKRLLLGNHDHFPLSVYWDAGFQKIYGSWRIDGVQLTHIPVHESTLYSAKACVHGHIHQNEPPLPIWANGDVKPYVNVSMEAIAYKPLAWEDVVRKIEVIRAKYLEGGD